MKSDDEWITVTLDTAWLKRLKYEQPKKRFAEDSTIQIRVVRYNYTYYDKKGKAHHVNLKYFTNLSEKEFSKMDIVALYAKRWDIECSYKTLKTDYEWERYFSVDCNTEICSIFAKVLFHNINGIVRKEMNEVLEKSDSNENHKVYVTNIVQLSKMLRYTHLCRYLRNKNTKAIEHILNLIFDLIDKIKVPVRSNRHSQRWGRHLNTSKPTRFRLDGRNWPNTSVVSGQLRTVKP